ncbi:hypothetical protein GCM10023196_020970 [Actinoallomurus vinaceus]|uniref:Cupin type-2 domain-containing protein n=1 Tax=Actinoallomurus vinaceus TaxID=1080074 RepID=A0ABP8U4G5_9ACTN
MRTAWKVLTLTGCSVALLAGAAGADPEPPPTAVTLADGTMQGRVTIRTGRATEVVVRTITIPPGGTTGWHYHPGRLIGVVRSGTLTRYEADCRPRVYPVGSALVEPSGPREVHLGRNLGRTPVVLVVTYLDPVGAPLAVPVANPGCPVS